MPTPIPQHRLAAVAKAGICQPGKEFLATVQNYEDLAAHPEWAFLVARFPGADVARLQAVVDAHGSAELRAKFRKHVRGATP